MLSGFSATVKIRVARDVPHFFFREFT